jgi:hypothetical protein
MAYTIFNTRNNEIAVVEDGTIDNSTDLKLIGKNYAGYGEIQNENFVYLLENFAGANQPPRPIAGQLWFDTDDSKIKVYDGNDENVFVPLGNVHIGAKPTGAAITAANVNKGDLWWDDVTSQLYAHNGALAGDPFVLIGPKASQDVRTEITDTVVYDNLFAGQADPTPYQHKILKGFVDDTVVFIASNDEFTLDDSNAIAGFDRIKKGITLVNTQNANDGVTGGNYSFHGSAADALRLGGTLAQEFVQRSNPVFVTQVDIDDNDGLLIGPNNEVLLKVGGGEAILESTITGAKMNFKVKDTGGSTVTPLTLTENGLIPISDNTYNIGSASLRWGELHVANLRGVSDKADSLLSDGTYRIATKTNTNDAIVTRDSVGDIFATSFRGTHLINSTDVNAAVTGKVTKSEGLLIEGTDTFVPATTSSVANRVVVRDGSGQVFADQFNGLATRAATLRVPTGVPDQYEHRSAAVADLAGAPNTVAVRDSNGKLYATEFVGSFNGQSTTAAKWTTPRTITVDGDASGSVTIDGSQDATLTIEVGANQVALGTDTTGNYVNGISVYNNDPYMNIYVNTDLDGAARENALVQLGIDADTAKRANTLVARDVNNKIMVGEIDADGPITAQDIDGDTITASTRLVGHVNQSGTSNDGWFDNLTVGTINATNINFGASAVQPIANGGTGATTASAARTNLDIYSKAEVDSEISGLSSQISGISSDRIVNGTSRVLVTEDSDISFRRNGQDIASVTSNGIELGAGYKFVGTATEAEYADLAEKYTTEEELPNGTVVAVGRMPGHEVDPANRGDVAIGVVSTDPALMMNSKAEGQYIGLKGRLPVRVVGAVRKGDAVYVDDNGCASTAINGGSIVGIALETNSVEEEKLVECVLKV